MGASNVEGGAEQYPGISYSTITQININKLHTTSEVNNTINKHATIDIT